MPRQVFIINGSGGCGKDTFIKFCTEVSTVYNLSTVDKVKEAGIILGWNGDKTDKDREFLSDLKLLADKYYDHSIKYILNEVYSINDPYYTLMIFIHCREPENIERLKTTIKNSETILIRNPNVESINSNMADANVENYKYDHIIMNDGTLKDLENKAIEFISRYNLC